MGCEEVDISELYEVVDDVFGTGWRICHSHAIVCYIRCNVSSVTALLLCELIEHFLSSVICPIVAMDPAELRLMMVRRGAAVVVVLCTWFLARLRSRSRPSITYAPMSARDEERQNNLAFIYQSSDIQCV